MRVGVFSQEECYGNPTGSRALPDDLKEKFEIKKSKKVSGNGHQNVCNCRTGDGQSSSKPIFRVTMGSLTNDLVSGVWLVL